jgi:hypothetical protein
MRLLIFWSKFDHLFVSAKEKSWELPKFVWRVHTDRRTGSQKGKT